MTNQPQAIPIPLTTQQKIANFMRALLGLPRIRQAFVVMEVVHTSWQPEEVKRLPAPAVLPLLPAPRLEKESP